MTDIPIHKATQQTVSGVFAKELSPDSPHRMIEYPHRDDYYEFAIIESGTCAVNIDFKDYNLSAGQGICVQPYQVHRVIDRGNAKALLLFIDATFINPRTKHTIAEHALSSVPFVPTDLQHAETTQLFSMILHRINENKPESVRHLSLAIVDILAEVMQENTGRVSKNKRHLEIALAFKKLLPEEKPINRDVSCYAEALHISPVYLNEVIKDITGMSVSKYIQNELVLRAKRMLVHTSLRVNEIALCLGIEDGAYFTRLFTKAAGMPPTRFREKYLE